MNEILYHLGRIDQLVVSILNEGYVNQNPLEVQFFTLLKEEHDVIQTIYTLSKNNRLTHHGLKTYLSVIYRDDEVFDPTLRAWVRASQWLNSASSDILASRKSRAKEMRNELKAMVPHVQNIFGKEKARFIVPPLMRDQPS